MEAGRWGEKKTLHHANDLAPGSFSFCQESPFQFEWIWIKRISHKGQVWPKQHFVCKSTGSKRSILFLPLSCSHYQRPACQRQLSVKVDDDQPTLRTTTASTPVISAARFTSPRRQNIHVSSHLIICRESAVPLLPDVYVPEGQLEQIDRWDTRARTLNDNTDLPAALTLDAVTIIVCCGQTAVFNKWRQNPKGTHTITVEGKQH